MKKSFILGIGSQRAGSTFIAKLLNQHPEIAIHPLKELHYFDTMFGLRNDNVLKEFSKNQLDREINKLCNAKKIDFVTSTWQWYIKTNYQLFTKPIEQIEYFDLFNDMVNIRDIKFMGESTPEYMLLNRIQISKMKAITGDAYIIIICRNPVKRIISAFRLLLEYGKNDGTYNQEKCDELFLKLIDTNDIWIKRQIVYSNYKQAIENYSNCFDKVLFLSYDNLIKEPQNILDSLSRFTNLDFREKSMLNLFKNKINSLSVKYNPKEEIIYKLTSLLEKENQDLITIFGSPLTY